jgi:hypothetical protein
MCNCFKTKLQELDLNAKGLDNVVSAHSLWSDAALNFSESSELGLSSVTNLKLRKNRDRLKFELKQENSFIPFFFCPFCGEKLDDKELHLTQEEDDALLKIFYVLEENLEDRLENLTVRSMDEAIDLIIEEMDALQITFLIQKDDEKQMIKVLHKGNFQDYTIEIYLEADEDGNENLYTLNVF